MAKALDTFRHPIYKHNCAQAIANKWQFLYGEENIVDLYTPYVAGHAPEGFCGALYAAMQACPLHKEEIKMLFSEVVGDVHCHDIKRNNHTPCETCVDTADNLVEQFSNINTKDETED